MDQDEEQFMIYIANLKVPEKSFYTLPWGQVVMMGCDQEGELLSRMTNNTGIIQETCETVF